MIYHIEKDLIYVANIIGKPATKDRNGFIAVLKSDGNLKNITSATGLNAPKVMAISKNKLYFSDIGQLVEID